VEITPSRRVDVRAEQATQIGHHRSRIVMQLPPGDPDDPPAGGLESPVAAAVALERGSRCVKRLSVQLGDPQTDRTRVMFGPYIGLKRIRVGC